MDDTIFDLAVIGSGPAGQRAAVQAAKLSKKAIVIEKDKIGGSCLHFGTIPSKTLRQAVLDEKQKNADILKRVMKQKENVLQAEVDIIKDQLKRNGVEFVNGAASFSGPNTIKIESQGTTKEITAKNIIIATGTRPRRPTEVPFTPNIIMDSDSILALESVPKSICIIGAGVIGCEYASIFLEMGTEVTLVDRRNDLLRGIDREIVAALQKHFELGGLDLLLECELGEIALEGTEQATVELNEKKIVFDSVLYCMGRVGNIEELNLEKAGLKANQRNLMEVNKYFQTSVEHIYAVGDILGAPALAATAYIQGRFAANHALSSERVEFPKFYPYGIYTIPEISSAGAEESELIEHKIPYVVGVAKYKELARGKILEDDIGLLKLLFHKENQKLLGVHIIGTQATELVHIGQLALSFEANMEHLLSLVFNYPTLAEGYKVACLNAYNQFRQG